MVKGSKHTPEARARIAHGTRRAIARRAWLEEERQRLLSALYAVAPAELEAYRRSGVLSDAVAFCCDVASAEIARLRRAVEGEPSPIDGRPPHPLSAQRVARLGIAQRALSLALACQARALVSDDREAAATAGQLLAKADAIITATIGMDTEHEALSLAEYVSARRQEPLITPSAMNGADPIADGVVSEIATQEDQ
jgi:hypothetical protein